MSNHLICDRDMKKVLPGDCNDIARKRKDHKSQPLTRQGQTNYGDINWNSKRKVA